MHPDDDPDDNFARAFDLEADIDEDAGVFRYRSPQQRSRIITRPLSDIVLYALRIDTWPTDLCSLIGIKQRQLSQQRTRVPDHLWHLGNARIAGTHDFAPVFVGRLWERALASETTPVLCDPVWPRGGVLLRHRPSSDSLPRDHVMRSLNDFVRVEDGQDVFDASAFDRVLRGFVTASRDDEPEQFLQGLRVKLPHFEKSRLVSEIRAAILKFMWGVEGKTPPAMSKPFHEPPIQRGHPIYRMMLPWVGSAVTRYHRITGTEGIEKIPEPGVPVILVCNHQNGLMDPLIHCGLMRQHQVHFQIELGDRVRNGDHGHALRR